MCSNCGTSNVAARISKSDSVHLKSSSNFRVAPGRKRNAMYAAMKPFEKKYGLIYTPHFSHWYEWGTMIYARFKIPKGPDRYEDAVKVHDEVWNAGLEAAFEAGAELNTSY